MAGVDNTVTPPRESSRVDSEPPATSLGVVGEDQNSKGGSPVAEIAPADEEIFCGEATG